MLDVAESYNHRARNLDDPWPVKKNATAAVADYTVKMQSHKIKKTADKMVLELEKTVDILSTVTQAYPQLFTVGFCAETQDLLTSAQQKRAAKGCHAIVANQVTQEGFPFGSERNTLSYLTQQKTLHFATDTKTILAKQLAENIAEDFQAFRETTAAMYCHKEEIIES